MGGYLCSVVYFTAELEWGIITGIIEIGNETRTLLRKNGGVCIVIGLAPVFKAYD